VKHIADRVAVMNVGRIVETAPAARLFAAPRHPYGHALLSAIPIPNPQARRDRMILQGDMPSALHPPSGCRFHTRCPYVIARCRDESPALIDDNGHATACHRWPELPARATAAGTEGAPSPALERLMAAFSRVRDVEPDRRVDKVAVGIDKQ
jgi:oligopeptide/dipeptide ABC transporter ATP-binding protein